MWPLVHQVEQPAGRGDEDVDAILQSLHLRALADATVNHGVSQARELAVGLEALADLCGQFAGWCEDQRPNRPAIGHADRNRDADRLIFALAPARIVGSRRRADARAQTVQRGQRERGRFAGAGLGAAHEVATCHDWRNRLLLDRRRRVIALGAHGAEQWIGEA